MWHRLPLSAAKSLAQDQQPLARSSESSTSKGAPAQKRIIAQDALTEAVDGVNRGVVKLAQGGF